jgi:hypothetical protein
MCYIIPYLDQDTVNLFNCNQILLGNFGMNELKVLNVIHQYR